MSENIKVVSITGDDIFRYHTEENKFAFYYMHFDEKAGVLTIFSSPEPKVQGELLVSKGDAPASVVRRPHSSSPLKLLVRNTSNLVCSILASTVLKFVQMGAIGPY